MLGLQGAAERACERIGLNVSNYAKCSPWSIGVKSRVVCVCGRGINRRHGSDKRRGYCSRCTRRAPRPVIVAAAAVGLDVSCPHCCGISRVRASSLTCCVCQGTRRVDLTTAVEVMRNVWARAGCACGACACHSRTEQEAFPDIWPAHVRAERRAMGCKVLSA